MLGFCLIRDPMLVGAKLHPSYGCTDWSGGRYMLAVSRFLDKNGTGEWSPWCFKRRPGMLLLTLARFNLLIHWDQDWRSDERLLHRLHLISAIIAKLSFTVVALVWR